MDTKLTPRAGATLLWLQRAFGMQTAETGAYRPVLSLRDRWLWPIIGLAGVIGAFAYLEATQPYYFSQDDNFCEMFPVLLQGCGSFFSGVFPQWNPYQLLGAPTTRLGLYGLTYPPLYASYALARFVLGNEYAAFEILAFMHLLMGFVFMYWAARQWKVAPPLAAAAGVAYILSGYALVVGRSWGNILLTLAWLPLYLGAVAPLTQRRVTWKWIGGFGLLVGLSYHSGFVQLWVYALAFTGLATGVLFLARAIPFTNALCSAVGLLAGLAIAAPLLYVQMTYGASVARNVANEGFPLKSLIGALLPYPLVNVGHPLGWGNKSVEYLGQFYYSGTIFTAVCLLMMPVLLATFWSRSMAVRNIWVWCAAIALLLALGDRGLLWSGLVKLPWFDKFRMPWRLYIFFNLFTALGGAIFLQRALNGLKRQAAGEILLAGFVMILMAYNVVMAKAAFYMFDDPPYPPPSAEMAPLLQSAASPTPQRAASLMPMRRVPKRSWHSGYALSLEQNFASLYGVPVFNGYDPLVWLHPFCNKYLTRIFKERQAAYRAWGVRWAVLYGRSANRLRQADYPELRNFRGGNTNKLYVWEVDHPAPLAFAPSRPGESFPISFSTTGARVDVSGLREGGPFVINILAWPDFQVRADGRPVSFRPDEWGRMVLDVPPGSNMIEARYSPPWAKGFALGAVVMLVALLCTLGMTRVQSRLKPFTGS